MSPPNFLQELYRLETSSSRFPAQIATILDGAEYKTSINTVKDGDLVQLVEYLDDLLGTFDPTGAMSRMCLRELGRICRIHQVLPSSYTLPDLGPLDFDGMAIVRGYHGDVHRGSLNGSKVRVKRLCASLDGSGRNFTKDFYEEAIAWKRLEHPNIVPLLGINITRPTPQLISDWILGGNLTEYIVNNPGADRLGLLSGIASGLEYLHSSDVVHGNLNGPNILVDDTGRARITDFGLVVVLQNTSFKRAFLDDQSVRWMAPEILYTPGTYSKGADVFSFAMVMVEAFSGAVPFHSDQPATASIAIMQGHRPPRPTHSACSDKLWALMRQCWDRKPSLRPEMSIVIRTLPGRALNELRRLYGPRVTPHGLQFTRDDDLPLTVYPTSDLSVLANPDTPTCKPATSHTPSPHEVISLVEEIFTSRDEVKMIDFLSGDDAQTFINVIHEVLGSPDLSQRLRKKCLSALCRVCGRQALLPTSVQIPLCYDPFDIPLYRGGYADVWKGEYQGRKIAVKVLRVYVMSDFKKITSSFCKEVVTWTTLRHPNVLPFLGVTMGSRQFAMASEWMEKGNVNEFIKTHREANRFELLKGVASGLIYMHGQAMIHGDLKGANILIDQNDNARLADFGLITLISDSTNPTTLSSSTSAGTLRWMSPELLISDQPGFTDGRPTEGSDCYALGMVIYEVLSGQTPFTPFKDPIVMCKIIKGERPGRPEGVEKGWFTDDLWETMNLCWATQPGSRPSIEAVFECLERVSGTWKPIPPQMDRDVKVDEDDWNLTALSGYSGMAF